MNVIEEISLKDTHEVNIVYLLFCTSSYQLLTVWAFFWVDIIPDFGFVDSVKQFGEKYAVMLLCRYIASYSILCMLLR